MQKAVFFDFDGTLTYKSKNIWKAIWKSLGYDTSKDSYFAKLFVDFMSNKITHQEWCNLTCEAFTEKGMNLNVLNELVKEIKLINGATETFKTLKENGYSLHIVSGNIIDVIEKVLGENVKYFDSINANDFYFNNNNELTYIKGTNYDFEGKAKFKPWGPFKSIEIMEYEGFVPNLSDKDYVAQLKARMNDRLQFVESLATAEGGFNKLPEDATQAIKTVVEEVSTL